MLVEAGDVVVPVLGGGSVARVVDEATAGAALGRNLELLRPDPAALDPWFLAGFLRGTANNRQASSYASTATRLDVRRLQLPRLPLADQRRYGERFRALAGFEDALRQAARLGEQLVQGLYDGLTDGTVAPRVTRLTSVRQRFGTTRRGLSESAYTLDAQRVRQPDAARSNHARPRLHAAATAPVALGVLIAVARPVRGARRAEHRLPRVGGDAAARASSTPQAVDWMHASCPVAALHVGTVRAARHGPGVDDSRQLARRRGHDRCC